MRRILFALLCLGFTSLAVADEKPVAPKTAAPSFLFLADVGKDKFVVTVAEMVPVVKNVLVNVEKNGVVVTETLKVMEYQAAWKEVTYSAKDMKVLDSTGKELKKEEGWKMLKPGMVVLTTTDANGVDPAYLKLLTKDALILVLPASKLVGGAAAPAPPAPILLPPPPKEEK